MSPTETRSKPRKSPASRAKKSPSPIAAPARKATVKSSKPATGKATRTTKAARQGALPTKRGKSKQAKPTQSADIVEQMRAIVQRALDDLKARDVVEIDVRGKTSVTDYLFIASGTSSRHVKSMADEVAKMAKQAGMHPLGIEGQREGEWVLVDLGDVVVHVMLPRSREFYGLERLWTVGDDALEASA